LRSDTVYGPFLLASEGTIIECPKGCKVQDVTLTKRSGTTATTGLNLPVEQLETGDNTNQQLNQTVAGWYPEETFTWNTFDNPDGSTTLAIRIYPFIYNSATTNAKFYKSFSFGIIYTQSDVEITDLTTDKETYCQGDIVRFEIDVNNPGTAMDVTCETVIKEYGGPERESVAGLILRMLDDLAGQASFSSVWDSNGFDGGQYCVEVTLKDSDENILDRRTEILTLGVSSCEITNLAAKPNCISADKTVQIDMTFDNTGTTDLEGSAVIKIADSNEKTIAGFAHDFNNLSPAGSVSLTDSWTATTTGTYKVLAYVRFDGETSAIETIQLSKCCGGPLQADLNEDCYVNFLDVGVLASRWLDNHFADDCPRCDIDRSGSVDYKDLSLLADQWLLCNLR